MTGGWVTAEQHKGSAAVAHANARVARAQGRAQKSQAYGQAKRIQVENDVAGQQHAENMSRLRENQSRVLGQVIAARGATGFTAEGSGSTADVSVLRQFEQVADDMAYSRSLQDQSARFEAIMARRSGDIAEMSAAAGADYTDAQADMYGLMARNANRAALVSGISQGLGAALGGYFGGGMGMMVGSQIGGGMADLYAANRPGSFQSMYGVNSKNIGAVGAFSADLLGKWVL